VPAVLLRTTTAIDLTGAKPVENFKTDAPRGN